jgi:23S rRNA (adenine2030-N6)-methyltransferase
MFAYRHAFHAGNHADVLKHLTLVTALSLMQKKDVPLWIIDTHAGAGLYNLTSPLVRDKAWIWCARLIPRESFLTIPARHF